MTLSRPDSVTRFGILGAGRAGTALARVAHQAGFEVDIAASRPPRALKYHLAQYAPHAHAVEADEIAAEVDLVVLMVPQEDLDDVDPETLSGVVLVDATNRWEEEPLPAWLQALRSEGLSSSEAVAAHFSSTLAVVKALNHISHWDLDAADRFTATPRRASALATDVPQVATLVAGMLDQLGFAPVTLPNLASGWVLEPGEKLFNRPMDAEVMIDELRYLLPGSRQD
ncbi:MULTISPECIES: NADPH-dependent F420 reductase [Auritidibacter]|uniref:NADPH-dependent F420 reductase n=1 Tax=Auritidibacter TaxID=1160973 RepID=UPI000D73CEFA|nr:MULTISPECIES: NAD(P)-binding domain-containing protein [Auritidibacter]PXA75172.1 hypothetical protein DCC26_10805 [Auritidibacter sp. NML120779]AXR74115.1 hypothetical protein DCC27_007190 [Auritidibacter sp. NML130574]NIH71911.1 hypothetical protein [Auritidibacter ignavus]PXA79522.1 hypothetical protein DCC25_08410 [Auritidibacter sp. NML120636]RMX22703.1 hypothetical protein DYI20_08230 [Auritidibacter ignavus]